VFQREEEALAAVQEAVAAYRRLAEVTPDAFLPNLAHSLNNLSNRLSEVGRREEALAAVQEAVAAYRRLAEVTPDAFLPNLAMSLRVLAQILTDLDREEEAAQVLAEHEGLFDQKTEE
jgi:tetratricopeptide (TPR) repeat protein